VGITILESTGLRRMQAAIRDDLPLMPSLRDLLAGQETHHRTLFSVVPDDATVDRIFAATERLLVTSHNPTQGSCSWCLSAGYWDYRNSSPPSRDGCGEVEVLNYAIKA